MQKRLVELHRQRGQLIERIAGQRATLTRQLQPLQKAAATGGRMLRALQSLMHYIKQRPAPALLATAALLLLKPKGAWRWARRGLLVWRTWRAWHTLRAKTVSHRWF